MSLNEITDKILQDLISKYFYNETTSNNPGTMEENLKSETNFVQKEALKLLKSILNDNKSKYLIHVFRLETSQENDIELAILSAFLEGSKNEFYYEYLKLAIKWNRIDLIKQILFNKNNRGEIIFKTYQLESLMEIALIQNKYEIVELFLENGLNLKTFLNTKRLYYFYNSIHVIYVLIHELNIKIIL